MRTLAHVAPTPEQLTIVGDNQPGFLLIRGAAGSGKTTTALLRLRQLCEYWLSRRARLAIEDPVRVLVLTYNRTLEGYISELARQQVKGHVGLHLQVRTFGKWALDLVGDVDILDRDDGRRILRRLVAPLPRDSAFLMDEVEYLLSRFDPSDLASYVTTRREGRGASPRVGQHLRRRLLSEVVKPYGQEKDRLGVNDWNDIAVAATSVGDVPAWSVVVVDEAQDFSANQIRAIVAHLATPSSTTFVMDAMQRIYPRYFAWREAGVQLNGVHTLRRNYRNTKQIAAFARPLVEGLPHDDDGALPDFESCAADGPQPTVVAGKYGGQIDWVLKDLIATVDFGSESIVFLQPRAGAWFDYLRMQLRRAGIPWTELTRASSWPTGPEAVALCTFHSAKGLEFDHVVMPGLNQQVTPHGADEGDAQLEILRRLVAMGVGRARKSVTLGYKPGEGSTVVTLLDRGTYREVRV